LGSKSIKYLSSSGYRGIATRKEYRLILLLYSSTFLTKVHRLSCYLYWYHTTR